MTPDDHEATLEATKLRTRLTNLADFHSPLHLPPSLVHNQRSTRMLIPPSRELPTTLNPGNPAVADGRHDLAVMLKSTQFKCTHTSSIRPTSMFQISSYANPPAATAAKVRTRLLPRFFRLSPSSPVSHCGRPSVRSLPSKVTDPSSLSPAFISRICPTAIRARSLSSYATLPPSSYFPGTS